jgi:hypothetical protein
VFRVPPWEFENQISSAWVTKLAAFKNEYTLDPAGARASAGIAQTIASAHGSRCTRDDFIERIQWVTPEEIADQHLKAALAMWPEDKP